MNNKIYSSYPSHSGYIKGFRGSVPGTWDEDQNYIYFLLYQSHNRKLRLLPSPAKAPLTVPGLSPSAHKTAPTSSRDGSSPLDPGSPQPRRPQPPSTVGTPPNHHTGVIPTQRTPRATIWYLPVFPTDLYPTQHLPPPLSHNS